MNGACHNMDVRIQQYREKYKRCAYCEYLSASRDMKGNDYFYCKVSLKPKFHITRRTFCKYYKVGDNQ